MENNNKKLTQNSVNDDRGALWAILLTIGMVVVMVILKQFLG